MCAKLQRVKGQCRQTTQHNASGEPCPARCVGYGVYMGVGMEGASSSCARTCKTAFCSRGSKHSLPGFCQPRPQMFHSSPLHSRFPLAQSQEYGRRRGSLTSRSLSFLIHAPDSRTGRRSPGPPGMLSCGPFPIWIFPMGAFQASSDPAWAPVDRGLGTGDGE